MKAGVLALFCFALGWDRSRSGRRLLAFHRSADVGHRRQISFHARCRVAETSQRRGRSHRRRVGLIRLRRRPGHHQSPCGRRPASHAEFAASTITRRMAFTPRRSATNCPARDWKCSSCKTRENVTARVMAAVKPGATPEEAEAAHKAIEAAIEKESFDAPALQRGGHALRRRALRSLPV